MKCTDLGRKFVHLQQGRVLIIKISFVVVNIYCTRLKPSEHDTNINHKIMEYFKHVYITQGFL